MPPSAHDTPGGLTQAEADRRRAEHGPNALPRAKPTSVVVRLARQFRSPLVAILLFALAFEVGAWLYEGREGFPLEAVAIFVTLALNAALGVVQEARSDAALARLQALAAPATWVVRDGRVRRIPASELVPGDLVRLESGDRVPADAKLAAGASVLVDESVLTGESVPVERTKGDHVQSGTLVVRGLAFAEVTRTGLQSAMGRLAHLLAGLELGETPLERRIDRLGRQIARAVVALSLALIVLGVLAEGIEHLPAMFLLAVALAVAAVPEELPAVLTLTLALGVERMAKRNALVRRLSAVEALGSVTVIATDKTGTLTENRLEVSALELAPAAGDADRREALLAMTLANDAADETDAARAAGDPLDLACLRHARAGGIDPRAERAARPRVSQTPFDGAWKYMRATVALPGGGERSYLKGAPEALLARSALDAPSRARWTARADAHAAAGHKVLALAAADGAREDGLRFLGLVAFLDPPRKEVAETIAQARGAGIRVLMLTGDHPATAAAIARQVGIPERPVMTGDAFAALDEAGRAAAARDVAVFARVAPEHKLDIVRALQAQGEVVAMTGDGVNDAPALKVADVGIAMGLRGSDVTREAASIVLLDDDLATVVHAIEEGRSLYENIQKFLRFMFSTSLGFLLLILGGAAGSWALGLRLESGALLLPLTAVQVLWINFLADGPPAFALGLDRNPTLLGERPRDPAAPLLDAASLRFILGSALVKAGIGLALLVLLPLLGYGVFATQAAVFAYEFLAQLAFAQPSRQLHVRPWPNPVLRWTLLAGVLVQLLIFALPPLRGALGLAALDLRLALIVVGSIGVTFVLAEALLPWARRAGARIVPARESLPQG